MELLNQLEQRIATLLTRLEALSAENAELKRSQAEDLSVLAEENHGLREELEAERARNTAALTRIEALVERIKERTENE